MQDVLLFKRNSFGPCWFIRLVSVSSGWHTYVSSIVLFYPACVWTREEMDRRSHQEAQELQRLRTVLRASVTGPPWWPHEINKERRPRVLQDCRFPRVQENQLPTGSCHRALRWQWGRRIVYKQPVEEVGEEKVLEGSEGRTHGLGSLQCCRLLQAPSSGQGSQTKPEKLLLLPGTHYCPSGTPRTLFPEWTWAVSSALG